MPFLYAMWYIKIRADRTFWGIEIKRQVNAETFADNSWYFRNALVRANYNDLRKGIHATTKFLEFYSERIGKDHWKV